MRSGRNNFTKDRYVDLFLLHRVHFLLQDDQDDYGFEGAQRSQPVQNQPHDEVDLCPIQYS